MDEGYPIEHGLCLVEWDDHSRNDVTWYFDKDFQHLQVVRILVCGWVFEHEDRYIVAGKREPEDGSFKHASCIDKRMVVSIKPLRIEGADAI